MSLARAGQHPADHQGLSRSSASTCRGGRSTACSSRRDTPDDVKATLVKAFKTAADNPQFVTLMKDRGNVMMNMSGAEADAFLKKWQSVTAWVLQDVGAAKASPEKFGIPKP